MTARSTAAAIAMAGAVLLGAAACGGSSDAGKEPAGKPSGKAEGGDVALDPEDGTLKYTDEDGNETEMNVDGDGASVPKGWPSALDPPDSVTLITSSTATEAGRKTMTLLGEAEGSVADLLPAIEDQVTGAGFTITQGTDVAVTGTGYAGLTASKGSADLTVGLSRDPSDSAKTTISMGLEVDA